MSSTQRPCARTSPLPSNPRLSPSHPCDPASLVTSRVTASPNEPAPLVASPHGPAQLAASPQQPCATPMPAPLPSSLPSPRTRSPVSPLPLIFSPQRPRACTSPSPSNPVRLAASSPALPALRPRAAALPALAPAHALLVPCTLQARAKHSPSPRPARYRPAPRCPPAP